MYLWLSFYYFFEFAEDITKTALKTCIVIIFCCLLFFIFKITDFGLSFAIFMVVVILNIVSLNHVNDLIKDYFISTINRCLLLYMCLFMDINISAFIIILLSSMGN